MSTADNSRTPSHTQKCTWKKCPNPARAGKDTCKRHRNSKTNLARKSLSRLFEWHCEDGPHENENSDTLVEQLPTCPSLLYSRVSDTLERADAILLSEGPGDSKFHKQVYGELDLTTSALARQQQNRDVILLGRCFDTLSDFGTFDPYDLFKPLVCRWEAIRIYYKANEHHRLSRSISAYGQILRLLHHEREAGTIMHWGRNILTGRFRENDPTIAHDLHNELGLSMRFARCYPDEKKEADRYLLRKLTDEHPSPEMNLVRFQTEAGYLNFLNEPDLALKETEKVDKLRSQYHFQPYASTMLERPKIEALRKAGRCQEAAKRILTEFYPLYLKSRHLYTYDTIQVWMHDRHLKPFLGDLYCNRPPKPTFASAFFTHLPRI